MDIKEMKIIVGWYGLRQFGALNWHNQSYNGASSAKPVVSSCTICGSANVVTRFSMDIHEAKAIHAVPSLLNYVGNIINNLLCNMENDAISFGSHTALLSKESEHGNRYYHSRQEKMMNERRTKIWIPLCGIVFIIATPLCQAQDPGTLFDVKIPHTEGSLISTPVITNIPVMKSEQALPDKVVPEKPWYWQLLEMTAIESAKYNMEKQSDGRPGPSGFLR